MNIFNSGSIVYKFMKYADIYNQSISQDKLNQFLKDLNPNDVERQINQNNIAIDDNMISKIREIAPKIKLDDANIKKFDLLAKKLNINNSDIEEIKASLGSNSNDKITIEDIQQIFIPGNEEDITNKIINKFDTSKIKNKTTQDKLNIIYKNIKKKQKGKLLNQTEIDEYENTLNELKELDNTDTDKKEVEKYLDSIKDTNLKDITKISKIPEKTINEFDLPNIQNKETADKLKIIYKSIKKAEQGKPLKQTEIDEYENTLNELKGLDDTDTDKKEVENYLDTIKDNINLEYANTNDNKTIINFTQYASLFRYCLVIIITLCIIIYVIIVILSSINVIYLLIKLINSIISLFYNSVLTNEQTLSYNAKQIVKSTNNNFKYDIFNVLAEQKTALSIFNSVIYIIYILMAYVITYLLLVIYVQMMKYTHILKGTLADIDSKYQILSIIGLLLLFSTIHLLIYKFIFKNMAISNFKTINNFEKDVDERISNIIQKDYNNTDECSKFFDLLSDTSKRNELDSLFATKVKTIKVDSENNLRKYLMMYNIYMYFEEYLYMNDVMKEKIKNYFGISKEEDEEGNELKKDTTFVGLLDSNERKLLKLYHEDLPFHSFISKEYLEEYQKINEDISTTINNINKYIIRYTGTFFPFLITCIYIFIICIYNIYTLYILFKFVLETEPDNIFITFIYTFSHKYIYYCEKIYSFFYSK